jgi:hypothetical protein
MQISGNSVQIVLQFNPLTLFKTMSYVSFWLLWKCRIRRIFAITLYEKRCFPLPLAAFGGTLPCNTENPEIKEPF